MNLIDNVKDIKKKVDPEVLVLDPSKKHQQKYILKSQAMAS